MAVVVTIAVVVIVVAVAGGVAAVAASVVVAAHLPVLEIFRIGLLEEDDLRAGDVVADAAEAQESLEAFQKDYLTARRQLPKVGPVIGVKS